MSTAAPAAPGAASPAPAPATPAPTGAAPAGEPNAQPVRTIKPIPPRLPGVLEDGPEPATERAVRERDEGGRFLPKSAAGEPSGAPVQKPKPTAVDAADGEPTIPDLPDAKPKFKFAGREFDTPEAAENEYKRQMERLKPTQQKVVEYEGKLVKAAESARGWKAVALEAQAELEALRANPMAAQPAGKPKPAPGGIDWALYAEIAKVAQEAGEPWKAQQWLAEQTEAQINARLDGLREEVTAPWREQEAAAAEQAQLASTADALVNSMAAHTNPDGTPAFPEFRDGEQTRAVGELWQSLGLDPRLALTPGGAVAAVALYRMARGMDAAPPPAPPAAPPSPDPAALAAAGLEGGRPVLPSAADRRSMDPGVARLVAGLRSRELLRPGLGFDA